GIPGAQVDGNDPIASWHALQKAMNYCRHERRPYLLEAMVSRLYGHSSSSGALRVREETDCIPAFEEKLLAAGAIDEAGIKGMHRDAHDEVEAAADRVLAEPKPEPEDRFRGTFADSSADVVYPGDYTGLPQ